MNPFPPTAITRLADPGQEFWSLDTESIKQAKNQLRVYLEKAKYENTNESLDEYGVILAIVGDYGTGKTHIAKEMLRTIDLERNPNLHALYLDSPSDTFLSLYKDRFIKKLDREEVSRLVDNYYADVVADELGESDLTYPVVDALRSRKVSPDSIVSKLGLMESKFIRILDEKLKKVTEQTDFGTALVLLRRPGFQSAVWEWLEGKSPDIILQERGITRQINTDAAALEAIGVMAFLFGRQKHRFMLFIDEIEKVLSKTSQNQPDESAILALKKLMEAMSQTRALLVLIGLPEFLDFLPDDAKQRISSIIHPSSLTSDEISTYIEEAQQRTTGSQRLEPFTKDSIDYLREIAGGNTRKMVRLCYHAYIAAENSKSAVTRPMLRQIAREQFELSNIEDITVDIRRTIDARGWLYESQKIFTSGKVTASADFWLPVGDTGSGITILISRSILQDDEAVNLLERVLFFKTKLSTQIETILIVNGYISDSLKDRVEKEFDKVIVFRLRSFYEELESVLIGARVRLEMQFREDQLSAIRFKIDEIGRQNNSIDHQISRIDKRNYSIFELQAAISAGVRDVFAQISTQSSAQNQESLFPSIISIFNNIQRRLEQILLTNNEFDYIFGIPEDFSERSIEDRVHGRLDFHIRDLTNDYLLIESMGRIQLFRELLRSFRSGVFRILSANLVPGRVDEYNMSMLSAYCQMFETTFRSFSLDKLLFSYTSRTVELRIRVSDRYYEGAEYSSRKGKDKRSDAVLEQFVDSVNDLPSQIYDEARENIMKGKF